MKITTASYWSKSELMGSGLVPVAASVGLPKFWLGYDLKYKLGSLAPYGGLMKIPDQDDFRAVYFERLDAIGPETIRRAFQAIVDMEDARGVAILCFERLDQPGEWCHRRTFAEWWRLRTDEEVEELGPAQLQLA